MNDKSVLMILRFNSIQEYRLIDLSIYIHTSHNQCTPGEIKYDGSSLISPKSTLATGLTEAVKSLRDGRVGVGVLGGATVDVGTNLAEGLVEGRDFAMPFGHHCIETHVALTNPGRSNILDSTVDLR